MSFARKVQRNAVRNTEKTKAQGGRFAADRRKNIEIIKNKYKKMITLADRELGNWSLQDLCAEMARAIVLLERGLIHLGHIHDHGQGCSHELNARAAFLETFEGKVFEVMEESGF